jgi:hypothetical protein
LFSITLGAKPVNGFSKAKRRLDKHMLRSWRALARGRGRTVIQRASASSRATDCARAAVFNSAKRGEITMGLPKFAEADVPAADTNADA